MGRADLNDKICHLTLLLGIASLKQKHPLSNLAILLVGPGLGSDLVCNISFVVDPREFMGRLERLARTL